MGYRCTITAKKDIEEKDVQEILDNMPEKYRQRFDNEKGVIIKQQWGWPCAIDIYNPEGNTMGMGGSVSISGMIAYEVMSYIQVELDRKGYETELDLGDLPDLVDITKHIPRLD